MEDLTGENRGNGEGKSRDGSTTLAKNGNIPQAQAMVVPIGKILPDPYQPRKEFDAVKMNELVENIREHGILQRLIVRPGEWVVEPGRQSSGTGKGMVEGWFVFNKQWQQFGKAYPGPFLFFKTEAEAKDSLPYYVLTAGERRLRAATTLGLKEVPVDLVNTKNVFAVQMSENLMRENLSALAEAEAYRKQVEGGKKAEEIAKELGVSRATVFSRLTLTRLHKPMREALIAGQVSTTVAGLIGMVPEPKAQEELLKQVAETEHDGPMTFRQVQNLIEEDYCRQLAKAPFDTKHDYKKNPKSTATVNGTLVSGTCAECPQRSGNMTDAFPDLAKRPNVCTAVSCYKAKATLEAEARLAEARAKGQTVIALKQGLEMFHSNGDLKYNSPFIDLSKECEPMGWDYKKDWKTALGKECPVPIVAIAPNGEVRELLKKEVANEALKKTGKKPKAETGYQRSAAEIAAERARQTKEKLYRRAAEVATRKILDKLATMKGLDERVWMLMSWGAYHATDITVHDFVAKRLGISKSQGESREALQKYMKTTVGWWTHAALTLEMLVCARWNSGGWHTTSWHKDFEAISKLAGVDLDKLLAELKAEKKAKATSVAAKAPAARKEKKSKKTK